MRIILITTAILLLSGCSKSALSDRERIQRHDSSKRHHITEKPYIIKGELYVPQLHYRYDAVGEASWYGASDHGKQTATQTIFNKHNMTAAHRTLPIPSVVLVTNLSNKRRIRLLVNDRGPFAQTERRIIDVSEAAARALGFHSAGRAIVHVRCIPAASRQVAREYNKKPY